MLPPINETNNSSNEHCKKITKTELKGMIQTYRDGLDPNETKSCTLSLRDIEYLIKYYSDLKNLNDEAPIGGFRIYFYRPALSEKSEDPPETILKVGNKGQMSIILFPTNNYQSSPTYKADDMFNADDECLVLWPGGEHPGLCPKNCQGSI